MPNPQDTVALVKSLVDLVHFATKKLTPAVQALYDAGDESNGDELLDVGEDLQDALEALERVHNRLKKPVAAKKPEKATQSPQNEPGGSGVAEVEQKVKKSSRAIR